ncbi:formylglycine-generating enzyme required for sulfatase activity [Tamilnaduibacter salinus]|uniref:Formylglycine-generating enzyme required for sulfatase activity n=1 Tax=Tamilnaduibacter salinus TaxID=1484056 RepID=A0A2U1CWC3_9GAMM|nr:SUMF1/EgtB/PvdO family nonheme iron enzyme [Tamilnaduibacter salinus]PVY76000.1 formylglycine-generating enzyme required for sulfatase activity [Tamilnaduibacter salinus]
MHVKSQVAVLGVLLVALVGGCSDVMIDSVVSPEQVRDVVERNIANLVYVEGGTFMLGDVGVLDGSPYTTLNDHSKPPVEVTLNSYSISKYETTWGDFVLYLKDVDRIQNYTKEAGYTTAAIVPITSNQDLLSPNYYKKPARSPNYHEAKGYCDWLAEKSGLPFALPTEAQWEYAARSRGRNVPYATDDGTLENDTYLQRPEQYIDPETPPSGNALGHSSLTQERRAVGSYPPSPLGLYDMTGNLAEWTQDWFDPDHYQHIDSTNPGGPEQPLDSENPEKVVRDYAGRGDLWGGAGTVFARSGENINTSFNNGFRCVVNQSTPVQQ